MFVNFSKMNDLLKKQILFLRSKGKKSFKLTVDGTSMLPVLQPGSIIEVCAKEDYFVGDILVFLYKDEVILAHRLLKIENERYFCKGDNSFRLEDIEKKDIVGAVLLKFDVNNTFEFIAASYSINRLFRKSGYNISAIKASPEYAEYAKKYLGEKT